MTNVVVIGDLAFSETIRSSDEGYPVAECDVLLGGEVVGELWARTTSGVGTGCAIFRKMFTPFWLVQLCGLKPSGDSFQSVAMSYSPDRFFYGGLRETVNAGEAMISHTAQ